MDFEQAYFYLTASIIDISQHDNALAEYLLKGITKKTVRAYITAHAIKLEDITLEDIKGIAIELLKLKLN